MSAATVPACSHESHAAMRDNDAAWAAGTVRRRHEDWAGMFLEVADCVTCSSTISREARTEYVITLRRSLEAALARIEELRVENDRLWSAVRCSCIDAVNPKCIRHGASQ